MTDQTGKPEIDESQQGRVDLALSRALAETAPWGAKPKECYYNSATALLLGIRALPEGTVYCEGWVLILGGSLPIDHAYLETPTGQVIDITLPLVNTDDEMAELRYVAARRYTRQELQTLMRRNRYDELTFPVMEMFKGRPWSEKWWQRAHFKMMTIAHPGIDLAHIGITDPDQPAQPPDQPPDADGALHKN